MKKKLNRASQRITTKVCFALLFPHCAGYSRACVYGRLYMPLCLLVCCIYILLRDYMLICEQQHALPVRVCSCTYLVHREASLPMLFFWLVVQCRTQEQSSHNEKKCQRKCAAMQTHMMCVRVCAVCNGVTVIGGGRAEPRCQLEK